MNIKEYVEQLDLSVGATHRGNCPACHRKGTFTAKNDMGTLLWNCYANSCNVSGGTRANMRVEDIKRFLARDFDDIKADPFTLPEWVVIRYTEPKLQDFCAKWGLNAAHLDLRYDIREDRVVFPVYDPGTKLIVDAVGRAVGDTLVPKWKRYGTSRTAYVRGTSKFAFVVEDCVSAAIVEQQGGTGFALLGTALLDEHKDMLLEYASVVIALDPDALYKTVEYTRELRTHGVNACGLRLRDDIKYRNEDDIDNLRNYIGA